MRHLDPDNPTRLSTGDCRLIVVQDQLQPCPYLDAETARMPLRLPVGNVTPDVTDQLLAMGYRRSGDFLYRAQCPTCDACKPTRVEVSKFRYSSSLKRVKNRGDRDLHCRWGSPLVDTKRIWLFNQHRNLRGLGQGNASIDAESYRSFLSDTCCDTLELAISLDGDLVAVSIVDTGRISTSAVYTHFDPAFGRFSLGTYAVLKQIEWAQQNQRKYVYLGMYVAENRHLNYKARFMPQQRLFGSQWTDFDESFQPSPSRGTQV